MKKLLSLKTILICIAFTVLLLLIKDNMDIVWSALGMIASILTPFAIGFLIAYILNFPYKFFYSKAFSKMGAKHKFFIKFKKPLSIICTYLIVFAILVILIAIVVPEICVNIVTLFENMPVYAKALKTNSTNLINWVNSVFHTTYNANAIINEITSTINSSINSVISIENVNIDKISAFAGNTWNIVSYAFSGVYNFIMGIVISIYFLAAKESLCRQVKRLAVGFIPIKYLPKIYEIVDITDTKCGRFLVGDILDAGFVGLITFVIMSIFQLPYAPLIAVLIGVTNIIPFFGPFIGAIPSAFILFLVEPIDSLIFIIMIIIIQQLDGNLFKPKIIGSQVGLSSFWVLFSVIVGGALFGVMGLVLGTPIYAVIYALISKRVRNRINDKGKIAQEALEFEVLNYAKIAEEQKRLREEKENLQKEKIKKFIHLSKSDDNDKNDE